MIGTKAVIDKELINILLKCRALVGTFKHSAQLTELLVNEMQKIHTSQDNEYDSKILKLKQDVITR